MLLKPLLQMTTQFKKEKKEKKHFSQLQHLFLTKVELWMAEMKVIAQSEWSVNVKAFPPRPAQKAALPLVFKCHVTSVICGPESETWSFDTNWTLVWQGWSEILAYALTYDSVEMA